MFHMKSLGHNGRQKCHVVVHLSAKDLSMGSSSTSRDE